MLCKIAELIVEVPEAGGIAPRCQGYLWPYEQVPDIVIREDRYRRENWPHLSYDDFCYMESGELFYANLLRFGGLMLHASAVEVDGRVYLFSGPSGMGKSTHARLWLDYLGNKARIINDDKPALRMIDNVWYAYGTPWCGKDGINLNIGAPLAGICFLKRGQVNTIRRLAIREAAASVISQTLRKFWKSEAIELLFNHIDKLVRMVPIYELACTIDIDAAKLSHSSMSESAKELEQCE